MQTSGFLRALVRACVVLAVVAVPAFAADTVIDAVSGGRFVTLDGKRVPSVKAFFTNGTIQKGFVTEQRASKIVVHADGGPKCGSEWPHMRVVVDGVAVIDQQVDGVRQVIEAPVSLPPGQHTVRIRFDNDYYEPANAFASSPPLPLVCDRNLFVSSVEFAQSDGGSPPPPAPPPPPDPPPPPPGGPPNQADILWTGDAEKPWNDSLAGNRWPGNNEWVGYSCADRSRFSQVTSPVAQGQRAYRIEVRDGDDSYGERCELENGNTSESRLDERILFHRGQTAWIAFQTYLPADFSFASDGAPVSFPGDGGLLMQLKQLGSCGTPALGIVTGKAVFAMRNSAQNGCESGSMRSLWTVPMVLGRWVRWLVQVKFDTNPESGFTATWYDPDGLGLRPIIPRVDLGKPVEGNRIYTHTQKSPTDHPDPACPASDDCSHARIGIYRDPDVSGTSVIYHDGWTVARTRAAAEANAFRK
jgi:polysaccharide lyase-like protein/predicted xylan-binding protein with Ca-dependent carbohydrate-binding module